MPILVTLGILLALKTDSFIYGLLCKPPWTVEKLCLFRFVLFPICLVYAIINLARYYRKRIWTKVGTISVLMVLYFSPLPVFDGFSYLVGFRIWCGQHVDTAAISAWQKALKQPEEETYLRNMPYEKLPPAIRNIVDQDYFMKGCPLRSEPQYGPSYVRWSMRGDVVVVEVYWDFGKLAACGMTFGNGEGNSPLSLSLGDDAYVWCRMPGREL